ncbi:MAG: hypothetical protein U1F67_07970 [Rubrivivax sp.]
MSQSQPVQPPVATVRPSGDTATAKSCPSWPASMGTRSVVTRRASGICHTRTVLSSEAVTRRWRGASTATRRISVVCMPASTRSSGSVVGSRAAAGVAASASVGANAKAADPNTPTSAPRAPRA